jgi:hypothetical protein
MLVPRSRARMDPVVGLALTTGRAGAFEAMMVSVVRGMG